MIDLSAITNQLQDLGFGEAGVDLFYFAIPEGVGEAILVTDNLEPSERNEYLPKYKKSRFRIIVRRKDYDDAIAVAKGLVDELDYYEGTTIGSMKLKRLRAEYDPVSYPLPESDMLEVSVNFCAYYTEP